MQFQTLPFVVLFAAVLALLGIWRGPAWRRAVLLAASYVFYGWFNVWYLALIWVSTLIDYGAALWIDGGATRGRRRAGLCFSLVTNLGLLGFFKYYDFFASSANTLAHNDVLPILGLLLPVGISFYTFQSMAYTIDVYRGQQKATRSLADFALFVVFFPQLVAGPIVRPLTFLPQLGKPQDFERSRTLSGSHLFLNGLLKKVLVADTLAPLVGLLLDDASAPTTLMVWAGAFFFGVQIYADFSGYTDMARGIARILGFEFERNFNYPYLARSFQDFWRRWHISLSTWLRDYLYFSLGGSHKGAVRTYINLMLTMLLGGLWHGASWNFAIWGAYQGALLAIERLIASAFAGTRLAAACAGSRLFALTRWAVTIYGVFLGWLIFRVRDIGHLWLCIKKYLIPDFNFALLDLGLGKAGPFMIVAVTLVIVFAHAANGATRPLPERLDGWGPWRRAAVYLLAFLALMVFWPSGNLDFIYFQF